MVWCAALLTVLAAGGCGSFQRQWQQAAAHPSADAISGRWHGTWSSAHNGHTGSLRCIVKPAGSGRYDAWFHATYMTVMSAEYRCALLVRQADGLLRFTSEADLGWLGGGAYRQDGRIEDGRYLATYTAKADHGSLEMSRPDR